MKEEKAGVILELIKQLELLPEDSTIAKILAEPAKELIQGIKEWKNDKKEATSNTIRSDTNSSYIKTIMNRIKFFKRDGFQSNYELVSNPVAHLTDQIHGSSLGDSVKLNLTNKLMNVFTGDERVFERLQWLTKLENTLISIADELGMSDDIWT